MIQKTHFFVKQNQEELFSNETEHPAFRCLYATADSLVANRLPWHWHSAFEIDYITGCDVTFEFTGYSLFVPHGSAVFINAGALHSYRPVKAQACTVHALLFEPTFLTGNYDVAVFEKYITPTINSGCAALLLAHDAPASAYLTGKIEKMIQLCTAEPEYYELLLRAELLVCWCEIIKLLKENSVFVSQKQTDSERIHQMMRFIHANYSKKLSLADIAAAAMIGTRECSRCFQRSIGRSPMEYLSDYRIQIAIMQLTTTTYSVTEISEACGFSSLGYFGKVFKQQTGRSPLQFRSSLQKT